MAKEIRIEMKPRNNLVILQMERLGIKSVAELCRRAGLKENHTHQAINKIINLKSPPLKSAAAGNHLKEWKEGIEEIAKVLECEPEELFPDSIVGVRISRDVQMYKEISVRDLRRLGGNVPRQLVVSTDPEKGLQIKEFEKALETAFHTLTPREEKVLKYRFGFEGGKEHSLEEIGQLFAVSTERIRQIEAKAMRKLRHPARTRLVRKMGEEIGMLTPRG